MEFKPTVTYTAHSPLDLSNHDKKEDHHGGGDHNHKQEEEKLKQERRVWEEKHKPQPPKQK